MTLETQPNQPQNPEGISAQQYERFDQLQSEIMGRLRARSFTIVLSSNETNPPDGYHLSVGEEGIWSVGFGKTGGDNLNDEPDKPVELLKILKEYAFIQRYGELDQIAQGPDYARRYYDEIIKLRQSVNESVEDNPVPFAENFLRHMEKSSEELSKE